MTVKELIDSLSPHFNDCTVTFYYLDERVSADDLDEKIENFYIEPINSWKINVEIW